MVELQMKYLCSQRRRKSLTKIIPIVCGLVSLSYILYAFLSPIQTIPNEHKSFLKTYDTYKCSCRSLVLVVGYMRSGSSLVGDILQNHGSSFYVFEPLHHVTERYYANEPVEFLDGTKRVISNTYELYELHAEILYNWFTCRFRHLDLGSLTSDYLVFFSTRTRIYYECLTQHSKIPNAVSVQKCLPYLQALCFQLELRTIKVITLHMVVVRSLLEKLSDLRVIHLFRDPRGILQSQVRVKLTSLKDIDRQARATCDKMKSDIVESELTQKKFSERLKVLVYESLAEHPIEKSRTMFKWANLNLSPGTEKYIHLMTHFQKETNCSWCTRRKDSLETSKKWRNVINTETVRIIDKHCDFVYKKLGYVQFSNMRDLRNVTLPSRNEMSEFTKNAL